MNRVKIRGGMSPMGWTFIAIGAGCLVLCGVGGWFTWMGAQQAVKTAGPMIACAGEINIVRNVVMNHARETGKIPSADQWASLVDAEVREQIAAIRNAPVIGQAVGEFGTKPGQPFGCYLGQGKRSVFLLNAELAGKPLAEIKDRSVTLIFEDSKATKNGAAPVPQKLEKLPPTIGGQLRDALSVPVEGEVNQNISRGAGSPSDQPSRVPGL